MTDNKLNYNWGKHAILLVRVSTEGQDLSPQITDLEEYAKSKGYIYLHHIQTKESGLIEAKNRQGTNELFDFVKTNPEYRTVFSTEMSRLGRRESDIHVIKDWFVKNKIQFHLKDRRYQLFDENGGVIDDILFTLYGYFAESEIKQKKDRFARARRSSAKSGYCVSGKRLFGYNRELAENKKYRYVVNKDEAKTLQQIYQWYLIGFDESIKNPSIKQITLLCRAKKFPSYTHSKRNVNKLLKEKAYTGFKITNNKRKNPAYMYDSQQNEYITTSLEIHYPRIIDDLTFESVQKKLLLNNTNADKSSKHITLLSRLINCRICGHAIQGEYRTVNGLNKSFYRCSAVKNPDPCTNKQSIGMVLLDSAIWSLIKTDIKSLANQIVLKTPDAEINILTEEKIAVEDKIYNIEKEIKTENGRLSILSSKKNIDIGEVLSGFEGRIDKLDKELGKWKNKLAKISIKIEQFNRRKDLNITELFSTNIEQIELDKSLLKKYINTFIRHIKILHQSSKYSVIAIAFNYEIVSKKKTISNEMPKVDSILGVSKCIFIDKSNTNNIKVAKINWHPISFDDGLTFLERDDRDITQKSKPKKIKIDYKEIFSTSQDTLNLIRKFEEVRDINQLFETIPFKKLTMY